MKNCLTAREMFAEIGFAVSKEDEWGIYYVDDCGTEIYIGRDGCLEASSPGCDDYTQSVLLEKAHMRAVLKQWEEWEISFD